jgi:hypothetical protein
MSTNRDQSTAAGAPRCPSGWRTSAQNSQECFPSCPAGYTFKNPGTGVNASGVVDPNPSCVFDGNPEYYVVVRNVNINSPQSDFDNEQRVLNGNIAATNAEIGRGDLIENAKNALLSAENERGVNPDAYQQARVSYYTLLRGDTWNEQERQRVENEVRRDIAAYQTQISSLTGRINSQSQYTDIVQGTSDKVLQAKDDFEFMADSFSKQLDKIYTETQKQTRDAQNRILYDMSWIDTMLNWFIIAALVLAIGVVGYRLYQKYQYYYGKQTPVELAL